MADVLIDFNEGRQLHRVQQARLGELATDDIGNTWSYVQFREAVNIGDVVRDANHDDLRVAAGTEATVSAAAAIGTNRLTDSGQFVARTGTGYLRGGDDIRGAIGAIVDGAGEGQNFIVTNRINNDTIEVLVMSSATGFVTDGNWSVPLTNASTYRLAFPGVVYEGDALTDSNNVRGFSQVNVGNNELGRYGWVQQTGLGFVRLDSSDANVPDIGEGLVLAGNGLVRGFTTAGVTAAEAANIIAKSLLGDYGYPNATDGLMWAELCVVNRAQSYRLPHELHPFAQPGQRI